ncbi:hypothetical protein Psal006b_02637 [Piscirickettsia salmonis]|uniref:Kinase domain protein n=1 Tax=Piscirickettsia salmonis TaxID=1238 RepID=A0A1L6T9M8_PISSA|nr:hypothetical protein [Piscirickettsia salmonis]AKP73105.1 hypothetical protein PSLF89_1089 [Piscirickettsia salmonis LF-89 = ATCC VR-1361]ALB21763.1 kinase domain protein [Piscirickettsia salmonis]ALY01948.1 hypothetical protein AWE47_02920 [Piscirickettsia salmonis]AOS33945.1 hypothetical protein AVM72_00160 [Piscirickettsia salmonis]APS61344.1 hypothetical protein AVI53_12850 [Piscirickettsia salmonis]
MPKVIWLAQENRTAEQQQAAEWRIAKKHLTGKPPGTQLNPKSGKRKRRYLGRYFAHPMMQNRRAKRDDYKPSAVRVTQRYVP